MNMKRFLLFVLIAAVLAAALPSVSAAEEPGPLYGEAETANIQKYGNIRLTLKQSELFEAGYAIGDMLKVRFLDQILELPLCKTYSDVDSGKAGVFCRDDNEFVTLAINMGDFASTYGIAVKTVNEDNTFVWNYAENVIGPVTVQLSMLKAGGYSDEYMLRSLSYTNDRADYPDLTDGQFANFRAVATAGMGENVLYRSSSPVDPKRGRSRYVDAACRSAHVTAAINLNDSAESVKSYEGYAESYYSTIDSIELNLGVDFQGADFRLGLARGLRFMASKPGVYVLHCTEGKDRTGFVAALLECFMGADLDGVIDDYMTSFYNYYGVTRDDDRYDTIVDRNIVISLCRAFGLPEDRASLEAADLGQCAEKFLADIGLGGEEIAALRKNLSSAPAAQQPAAESVPESAETVTYIVRPGDCLWNIAYKHYGTGRYFTDIAGANGIKAPYLIYAGQSLVIPAR